MTISTDNNDEMRHGDTDKVREKGVNVKIEMDWCIMLFQKLKETRIPLKFFIMNEQPMRSVI